jgi:peptidoglycan hydrolase-like protein with peptidoglycan-binding domain
VYPIKRITRADMDAAAAELGVPLEVLKAVTAVEARRDGFISGTDLPVILFEGHKFHKLTRGVYSSRYPHLSHPKWTRQNYKGGRGEYDRLIQAIRINDGEPEPALAACSWGMFQIMGFNHELAGYGTVREYVNAMSMGEDAHLRAFVRFIESTKLAGPLRDQKWQDFARRYNGPAYKVNQYDVKLAKAFTEARMRLDEEASGGDLELERGDAAALQTALNVAISAGLEVDGWIGPMTERAIRKLQGREGMPETGKVDQELCELLGLEFKAYPGLGD